jgi:translation elongation factor P/translation initiation factor 5A
MSTSKTGKHGHAKVHMVALDIFTGMYVSLSSWGWEGGVANYMLD